MEQKESRRPGRILIPAFLLATVLTIGTLAYRQLRTGAPATDPAVPPTDAAPDPAPDFAVQDAAGSGVRLSDFRGRPVIVNFWATWCPPCRSELPFFEDAYRSLGDSVTFLMVDLTDGSRETTDNVKLFLEENGYTFPVYYDTLGSASNAYGIYSIPQTVCVDADGNLVASHTGALTEEQLGDCLSLLTESEEDPAWNSTASQE